MIFSRRSLLVGAAASLFSAPAIVRASSLMPVKSFNDMMTLDEVVLRWNVQVASDPNTPLGQLVKCTAGLYEEYQRNPHLVMRIIRERPRCWGWPIERVVGVIQAQTDEALAP